MKKMLIAASAFAVAVCLMFGTAPETTLADSPVGAVKVPGVGNLQVTKPQTYKNLTAFVLYRPNRPESEVDYLTLDEAAKAKLVEITEAPNEQVRQLAITYTGTKPLFLIAGELVKGGKQDRTLQSSVVIPPKTYRATLPSFCVEQSRWSGGKAFLSADNLAPNASQQALMSGEQGSVWRSVQRYKSGLRDNVAKVSGSPVRRSRTSSLNEELADTGVKDLLGGYEKALARVGDDLSCPLGLAYAVDGKMTAMHVFHSSRLFGKLKAKLIRSAAVDAAAGRVDKRPAMVTVDDLKDFTAAAGDGKKTTSRPGPDNLSTNYANDKTFTCLLEYKGTTVHSQVGRFDKTVSGGHVPMQRIPNAAPRFNLPRGSQSPQTQQQEAR